MIRVFAHVCIALLLMGSLALNGCSTNRVAKEVAALRLERKADAAREMAIAELQKEPKNLRLWRELAATDIVLARERAVPPENEPYRYAVEAALICAAMSEHNKGKLDEPWLAVASQTVLRAMELATTGLGGVSISTARGKVTLERLGHSDIDPERFVDTDGMQWVVKNTVPLMVFAQQLGPVVSIDFSKNAQEYDARVSQMGINSNITMSQVQAQRDRASAATSKQIAAAVQDLDDLGYFQAETILGNTILE
jgi:hypothetical protein